MTYHVLAVDGGLAFAGYAASGKVTPFVRRLLEARDAYAPAITAVAWDAPRETTRRRAASPAYKAKRPPAPEGYGAALADLSAVLPALDVVQFSAPGAEADDVLASIAAQLPGPTLLYSSDKDMLQAVRPGVDLLRSGSKVSACDVLVTAAELGSYETTIAGHRVKRTSDENGVQRGMAWRWWRDLLTLAGDPTDGVPGLPKVGPVKARAILRACPDFVPLVLAGEKGAEEARRLCTARDASVARWVEVAIKERAKLELSLRLVELEQVELEAVDAEPDPVRAAEWLRGVGLGRFAEEVAA